MGIFDKLFRKKEKVKEPIESKSERIGIEESDKELKRQIEQEINQIIASERIEQLRAYLFNKDPKVRKISVELMANNSFAYVSQSLCDLLGDQNEEVRNAVFKATWLREKDVCRKYVVEELKDEIQYGSSRGWLGPAKAKQALDKLVEYAPDETSRRKILEHINS